MAINTPPMGIGEAFGIAFETTFGVAVAPTIWWQPVSNTLKRVDPVLQLSGPSGVSVAKTTTRGFRAKPDISGTVVVEAEYDDIGHILKNTLGAPATSGPTETVVYGHVYNLLPAIPATMPPSMTCARITGLEQYQFQGCMVNSLEISGADGRIVNVSMDIIGSTGGSIAVADTIGTLSADPFIEFYDSIFRVDFSATGTSLTSTYDQKDGANATDWTLRIDNNLRRQQATGPYPAAVTNIRGDRPYIYSGYRSATMTVSRDFFDDNFFDLYNATTLAGTFGTFGITCVSSEIITGASTLTYSLAMKFQAGQIVGDPQEYNGGPDILGERIVIEAGYDGTNSPVVVNLQNRTSTYA
jgi:hypothetical protein